MFNNMHISCCHGNESKFSETVFWRYATVSAFSKFLSICLNNPRHLPKVGEFGAEEQTVLLELYPVWIRVFLKVDWGFFFWW